MIPPQGEEREEQPRKRGDTLKIMKIRALFIKTPGGE
jgi:hypothetical protein